MPSLNIGRRNVHIACILKKYGMRLCIEVHSRAGLLLAQRLKSRKNRKKQFRFHHSSLGETHLGTKYERRSSIIVASSSRFDHKKEASTPF